MSITYWWSEDRKWFCILADDGVCKSTVSLTQKESRDLAAAIDRLDVKAEAKSQEPEAVAVKPLEWGPYPHATHASEDVAVANVTVFGGHKYQAQRDPDADGYFAFLSPQYGTWFWTSRGHLTIDEAKTAAKADYEQRIRSALTHPTTKPEAPAVSVEAIGHIIRGVYGVCEAPYAGGFQDRSIHVAAAAIAALIAGER